MKGKKRTAYLENICAGDKELFNEIISLLDKQDIDWLEEPITHFESSFIFGKGEKVKEKTIGPYRIVKTIASGGMGQVSLAVRDDEEFERFVALKVIRKGIVSDDVLERFYEERQILASLNHPNIARLFDGSTTEDGHPWFAMEYIEGLPVTEYCKSHNLAVGKKINLLLKVCSAVQYAHQNLVIHRDLKPANILITRDGTPKLLDFGIAKLIDLEHKSGQTQYQHRMMTPEYASPEQVQNEPVTTVSDVYMLGVLLYELLAGALPYQFEKRTPAGIEQTICNEIPKRPSVVSGVKMLRGDLDSVVLKALRKKPSERYTSVEQFANDLDRYQKVKPVLAQKDSFGYHAQKFLCRNKWGVAVSVAVTLLVIVFTTVTFIQSKTIQARAVEAEEQRDRAEGVSGFLIDLFESVDPSETEDESLSAVELLHRGAGRVETELSNQPRLQSSLYLVISDVYESLGLYEEGLDLAQRAYTLQKKLYTGNHPEIAQSLNAMGWLYRQTGNNEKADSLLTIALAMRRVLYGQWHLDVARSLNDLAVLRQTQGDYAATDTLLQKAIKIRKALLGEQHESVALVLSNYAALKYRMGDLSAAEKGMQEALNIFLATVGENDTRVPVAMSNLASLLSIRGDLNGAEELHRKALNIRLRLFGKEHPDVAYSYIYLGNVLRAQEEYEEAEALLLKALNMRKKLLREDHILVGKSNRVLGFLHEDAGNYSKAENYYLGALAIFRSELSEGHANIAEMLHQLGDVYLKMKKFEKAELSLRKALEMRTQIFEADDFRTAASMIKLGVCLSEKGNAIEAKLLLTSGLEALSHSERNSEELTTLAEHALAKL